MFAKRIVTVLILLTIVLGVTQNTAFALPPLEYDSEGLRFIKGYKVKMINDNTYKLLWDGDSDSKKYVVEVSDKTKTKKYTTNTNAITLKNQKTNRKFDIYIWGFNNKGKKVARTEKELYTYLTKPVFVYSKFDKKMELEWNVDFYNVKVQLYRSDTKNGKYKKVGKPTKSELSHDVFYKGFCSVPVDDGAVVNNTYYYKTKTVVEINHKKKYSKFSKSVEIEALNSVAQIEYDTIYQTDDEALISIKSLIGNKDITFKPCDSKSLVRYSSSIDGDYDQLEGSLILKQENIMYFKITLNSSEYDHRILNGSYECFYESSYWYYCGFAVNSIDNRPIIEENWNYICY